MGVTRAAISSGVAAGMLGVVLGSLLTAPVASASHLGVDAGFLQYWLLDGPPESVPDPVPAECGDLDEYDTVVHGTAGDDVLGSNDADGNRPQLVLGYGGNDTLVGGSESDCLVGGPGDDRLHGNNARDVLLGGSGNDYLDGGNAKDDLDGGAGADTCIGGNGNDEVVNCEPAALPRTPEG